ncbi:sugar transferase [Planococcus lenghuensis]|uniref:Sugar transferase n=2 Tax=Planococcus lenghuensis TaxID=2213202 RepID=A0A1Q2L3V4_9BACL|nr:sugar transferase [Planococcus lenghuensis]
MKFFIKRVIDLFGSGIGLILLSPILIIVIILMKIFMPGPIFFKQKRVGKNQVEFNILKFRTMKVNKEAESKLDFSKDKDRLTKLGKLLRRSKVDELPQLLNVFLGDMSLVGPRPTIMKQVLEYTPHQLKRINVKPGMTGLAQINGNITLPWEQRIEYDIEYVRNFSLFLDFKILTKTLAIVSMGEEKFKKEKVMNNTD